ncbi:MAG: hypothetical protein GY704_04170, partial [Phycisphaeraceae bacterium]|nr:hypothetical protein [Phycisphaeraceae bacterium]
MADDHRPRAGSGPDEWLAFALIGLLGLVAAVWSGAQVATLVAAGHFLEVSFGDALAAMFRLTQHGAEPRLAWP